MGVSQFGLLYVVATPLGNMQDITLRALEVLKSVDLIAAEDTRHTQGLLSYFLINTPITSLHAHNEEEKSRVLIDKCHAGLSIALLSDAGTPLVSDPGQVLIERTIEAGISVVPIPGACAAITALCVSGLDVNRFMFEGFLPRRPARRQRRLQELKSAESTVVFYESKHRLSEFFQSLMAVMGGDRKVVVGRELTKKFEHIERGSLREVSAYFEAHPEHVRGEFVILVAPGELSPIGLPIDHDQLLIELASVMSTSKAAAAYARLTGENKNEAYQRVLAVRSSSDETS
jgi:16S rRNA (cytidine1402-2'-O)-methyltransferase